MTERPWDYDAVEAGQSGAETVVVITPEIIAGYAEVALNDDPRYHGPAAYAARQVRDTLSSAIPQNLGQRQPGIVVEHALGHTAQEGKGRDAPAQEGLGGIGGVGLHIAAVAMGQIRDEAVGLPLHASDDHHRLAEVALGVARRVGQRHEHLPCPAAVLPDVVLDYRLLALEPVLVSQPLEDALDRVALLAMEHSLVVAGLEAIAAHLPSPVRGIDSDNDSVFINDTLTGYCSADQVISREAVGAGTIAVLAERSATSDPVALGVGHPQPAVTSGYSAFDLNPSGHAPQCFNDRARRGFRVAARDKGLFTQVAPITDPQTRKRRRTVTSQFAHPVF